MALIEDINIENLKKLNKNQLEQLAKEIRLFLIDSVTQTGGHLASNLGVVELTLALHYVFDSPKDKLVWDVGHQAYIHKILTGRKDQFDSLRMYQGLSGFPRRDESEHDIYSMGHSSDSISVGLGLARARDFQDQDSQVVSIIGDGALTGGMALEALNDAGGSKTKMIVVLNDNEMSIAKNVGSIAGFLGKVRTIKSYTSFKRSFQGFLESIPGIGKPILGFLKRTKTSIKYFFLPTQLFEEMGFTYVGILDGHDMPSMINAFKDAEKSKNSVLIHVRTVKGCGCPEAENKPELYHGVSSDFFAPKKESFKSNGQIFAEKLIEMAKVDERIVGVTAAMPHGTGLIEFSNVFPERMLDVGIAEQHATAMCGGMAVGGMRPYFGVYSTFLQRAYDQIFHDICLQDLPVVFVIDRAGLVGQDGETHHGVFDISYLREFPNMIMMAPSTELELNEMLEMTLTFDHPSAIRYSKMNFVDYGQSPNTEFGKWKEVRKIQPLTIVAVGDMVSVAVSVADKLAEEGKQIGVINACFIKPMDSLMIDKLRECESVVTLEDNVIKGGFGSALLEEFSGGVCPIVHLMGVPDRFITHGDLASLYKEIGLDEMGVYTTVKGFL